MFLDDLKIYIMDLVDVFVLLLDSSFVQTNYKMMEEFFWGEPALIEDENKIE